MDDMDGKVRMIWMAAHGCYGWLSRYAHEFTILFCIFALTLAFARLPIGACAAKNGTVIGTRAAVVIPHAMVLLLLLLLLLSVRHLLRDEDRRCGWRHTLSVCAYSGKRLLESGANLNR